MVEERLRDGRRIAQLLASEIDGLGGTLDAVAVVDADPDAESTPDGTFAYRVVVSDSTETAAVADVFLQPDRARVEFTMAPDVAAERATEEGLRVRPKAVRPPRTLVFVEDGAQVKRVVGVFEAVVNAGASVGDEDDRGDEDGNRNGDEDGDADNKDSNGDAGGDDEDES